MTKILKVALKDDHGEAKTADAIEYEGQLYLVTGWNENRGLGIAKPVRIIQLEKDWVSPSPLPAWDLILSIPVPEALFHLPSDQLAPAPFFSIALPDIEVPLPSERSTHH